MSEGYLVYNRRVTYRDAHGARRAELDVLEGERDAARLERAAVEQKLARAETALSAYRKATAPPRIEAVRAGRVIVVVGLALWGSSVFSAVSDNDPLAGYLAAGFAGFATFAPLAVWASLGRFGSGVAILFAKIALSIGVAGHATARAAARTDSWQTLFWWAPLTLLVMVVFEGFVLLGRAEKQGERDDRIV